MKRLFISAFLLFGAVTFSGAQTPADDQQELLALIKEVQAQQKVIADNQAKIDAKLAEVTEAVRLARIYAKREK